jgi:hypothetical protein
MGFFNAMNCIGQINGILKETEYQIKIICDMKENNAPVVRIQQEVTELCKLYNQIDELLQKSLSAKIATYTFMGHKGVRSWEILDFIKQVIITFNYI